MVDKQAMAPEQVGDVIHELRRATEKLAALLKPGSDPETFDAEAIKKVLAHRATVVNRLEALVASAPNVFTESDLEAIRISQSSGKRALESLLETRRCGWSKAVQIARNQYFMSTLSSFGCNSVEPPRRA